MRHLFDHRTHLAGLVQLARWAALVIPTAILAGSASAGFLLALDHVTQLRWDYPWLLFTLPLGGFLVAWIYHRHGRNADRGHNLIMDEIHEPGGGVPARMAPLVLLGTLVTHLGGGSAGREGTAVQMGGALAAGFGRLFRVDAAHRRILLLAGVAAGFGSVFGTPLTGAVFALEVLTVGRIQHDALVPVLLAAVVGDQTCAAWGVKHTVYHLSFTDPAATTRWLPLDPTLLAKVALAGVAFGLVSLFFSEFAHAVSKTFRARLKYPPLRPVVGGLGVIAGVYLLGTRDYLGIGVTTPNDSGIGILSAFRPDGATNWSWLWKLLFTAITVGSGFKGGEVTPLFFIGATLGNALSRCFDAPPDLFAGLGLIAVFAGATNTPLACTVMGIELFGAQNAVYFATACFVAYHFSGPTGIYLAQRPGVPKRHKTAPALTPNPHPNPDPDPDQFVARE